MHCITICTYSQYTNLLFSILLNTTAPSTSLATVSVHQTQPALESNIAKIILARKDTVYYTWNFLVNQIFGDLLKIHY